MSLLQRAKIKQCSYVQLPLAHKKNLVYWTAPRLAPTIMHPWMPVRISLAKASPGTLLSWLFGPLTAPQNIPSSLRNAGHKSTSSIADLGNVETWMALMAWPSHHTKNTLEQTLVNLWRVAKCREIGWPLSKLLPPRSSSACFCVLAGLPGFSCHGGISCKSLPCYNAILK